jgi:hypothetical protein
MSRKGTFFFKEVSFFQLKKKEKKIISYCSDAKEKVI